MILDTLIKLTDKSSLTDWLTFLVALTALIIGWNQLRESRKIRKEQAQPNVFIDMRRVKGNIVELYVKNIGSTVAYDIEIKSNPGITSTDENFWMFDRLPALVPGQEWSTIWEPDSSKRFKTELPDTYHVQLFYKDSSGNKHVIPGVLDWRTQWKRMSIHSKDISDVANRLSDIRGEYRKISRQIQNIADSIGPDELGKENIIESLRSLSSQKSSMGEDVKDANR